MAIITTFNGIDIITLPCDSIPGVTAPSSIQWDPQEMVAVGPPTFTGQVQTFDWQSSWWEAQVSLPPMQRYSYNAWQAFILDCRGMSNAFMIGDPKAALPQGPALGSPVVYGANQTGYTLITSGWQANVISILLPGDYIQIGYRLYSVRSAVNSDSSGNATLSIWPNLRDLPAGSTPIKTKNCKGLFRLKANNGNKFSVNPGAYGFSGFAIRECL